MDIDDQDPKPTEPQITEPTEGQQQSDGKPKDEFGDSPKYRAMAQQLAELQREKSEREAAQEQARKEAEIKSLESKGKYEEAIAARDKEIERVKKDYESKITGRDITNGLIKAGIDNPHFTTGVIKIYDVKEHGDIDTYLKSVLEDESTKPFINAAQQRTVHQSPPKVSGGGKTTLSNEEIRALKNSDKQEERLAAIKYLKEYTTANGGNFPPGYLQSGG